MEVDNLIVVFISFLVFVFLLLGIIDYVKIHIDNNNNYIYIFSTIFVLSFLYMLYRIFLAS